MAYHEERRKHRWPGVEVFLIGEAVTVDSILAPFEAAVPPARDAGEPIRVAAERKPSDVEPATTLEVAKPRREAMLDDRDRCLGDLVEDRLTGRVEAEIRVDVGQPVDLGEAREEEAQPARRPGEVILDAAARRARRGEGRIVRLEPAMVDRNQAG